MAENCSSPIEGCKYAGTEYCIISRHHIYFPAKDYVTPTQKRFRSLSENVVPLPRCIHDLEHVLTEPPPIPSNDVMREAIRIEQLKRRNGIT